MTTSKRVRARVRSLATLLAAVASLALLAAPARAAPEAKLQPFWLASDESNRAHIDHGDWEALLGRYLHVARPGEVNRVDYAALHDNAADRARLTAYLAALQKLDPRRYSRAEQKPYWINLYNALTVSLVVAAYPVDSIKSVHDGWLPSGPWDDKHLKIAGQALTLNDIEHGILRPIWHDNRVHYALNCASLGCPNLQPHAFTAENTDRLLDAAAHAYVNSPRGVRFDDQGGLHLSKIYSWYVADFGGERGTLLAHLEKYAEPDLAEQLAHYDGDIDYVYDWGLNGT